MFIIGMTKSLVLTERKRVKELKRIQDNANKIIEPVVPVSHQPSQIQKKPSTPHGQTQSKEVVHSEPKTPQGKTPKRPVIAQIHL